MKQKNYLLDTNICVFLLRNKFDIEKRIEEVGINNCCVSEITIAELVFGAFCSSNPSQKLEQVKKLELLFHVIPIYDSIETYGKIKSDLRKNGLPIDDFDLLIGATAISNNLILVTDNTKHFNRLNLKLENWINRS